MPNLTIVLLSGLDGTGRLFGHLLATLPSNLKPIVVSYPNDLLNDYNELEIYATGKMPSNERLVLLAESFSGPVALNIAAKGQRNVVAVILVATFIQNPLHFNFLRFQCFIGAPLFRLPIPRSFIRNLLLGKDAPEILVGEFFDVLNSVNPRILAHRLRLILHANAKQALVKCPVPMLYLRATEDKVIKKRSLDVILRLRPDVESVSINAPHLLLQYAPLKASQVVVDFLQRHDIY
jgi:pimeloyl-ACP methyl ester carboxylesterase